MVSTGIANIDNFFHDHIPDGILIDVYGPSGIGKTQLAMQVSAHTVSNAGRILFHDTTGTFRPERIREILASNLFSFDLLDNIDVSRITNVAEQVNSVSKIDSSTYSLVVIDNISDLFSFEYFHENQFLEKSKLFLKYMQSLSMFAVENKTTVLMTNVMRAINNKQVENHEKIIDMFTHVKIQLDKIDPNDIEKERLCVCSSAFDKTMFSYKIMPAGLAVVS